MLPERVTRSKEKIQPQPETAATKPAAKPSTTNVARQTTLDKLVKTGCSSPSKVSPPIQTKKVTDSLDEKSKDKKLSKSKSLPTSKIDGPVVEKKSPQPITTAADKESKNKVTQPVESKDQLAKKRNDKLKKKEEEKSSQQKLRSEPVSQKDSKETMKEAVLAKKAEKRIKAMEEMANIMQRDEPQVIETPTLATGSRRSTRVRYQAGGTSGSIERPATEKKKKE